MLNRWIVYGCVLLGGLVAVQLTAIAEFKVGAATSNITPPLGQDIVSGFSPSPSTHVHDELHARCLVLDDGKTKLALVVCDLLGIHELVCKEACKQIEERSKIRRSNVMILATHTHSASSASGKDRFKYQQTLDDYQQFVARRIADGVARAIHNSQPAEMAFGAVEAPEHLFNRRYYMKPGTMAANPFGETTDQVKMNPGTGNANVLEPAGPIDPAVSFLAFRVPGGRPLASLTAYSLHYVGGVAGSDISADYFAVYCDELTRLLYAERLDPPYVALLANGTSGDVNNINVKQLQPRKKPFEQMRYVAGDVAAKVKASLDNLSYRSDLTLAATFREPSIRYRRPTKEQIEWAKKTVSAGPRVLRGADLPYAYAERTLRMVEYPETTPVPLQALRIGDVCIGTMPVEVFTEIGLKFKERSAQKPAFMIELANGYLGYLPTPRHHRLGGYETWLGTNRLENEASDKLLEELLAMTKELQSSAK